MRAQNGIDLQFETPWHVKLYIILLKVRLSILGNKKNLYIKNQMKFNC